MKAYEKLWKNYEKLWKVMTSHDKSWKVMRSHEESQKVMESVKVHEEWQSPMKCDKNHRHVSISTRSRFSCLIFWIVEPYYLMELYLRSIWAQIIQCSIFISTQNIKLELNKYYVNLTHTNNLSSYCLLSKTEQMAENNCQNKNTL